LRGRVRRGRRRPRRGRRRVAARQPARGLRSLLRVSRPRPRRLDRQPHRRQEALRDRRRRRLAAADRRRARGRLVRGSAPEPRVLVDQPRRQRAAVRLRRRGDGGRALRRRLPDTHPDPHRLRRPRGPARARRRRRRDRRGDVVDALGGTTMIVSLASLGLVVGYLGQRSRMCSIGGLRDFVLVRDTALLKGALALLVTAWVSFGVVRLVSTSDVSHGLIAAGTTPSGLGAVAAVLVGAILLGFVATLSGA